MFAHRRCVCAFRIGTALCLALSVAACATPPPPAALVASSDPAARVAPARYGSVVAGAQKFRPVEPLPWSETNRPPPTSPNPREKNQ
jgi:hypothetical protein